MKTVPARLRPRHSRKVPLSHESRPRRRIRSARLRLGRWALRLSAIAGFLMLPAAGLAAGGDSIASAPTIIPGQLQAGAGGGWEYWRIALVEGDLMTIRADGGATSHAFQLYDPSVDDYTLRDAEPLSAGELRAGKSQFTLTSPITGLGTIATFNQNCGLGCAFTFTMTIAHGTNVAVVQAPRRVRKGATFTLNARVQSPAGTPTGACVFRPIKGIGAQPAGPVPLTDGTCSAQVTGGTGRAVRYRVKFEGDDGWQDSSAATRKIKVRRGGS